MSYKNVVGSYGVSKSRSGNWSAELIFGFGYGCFEWCVFEIVVVVEYTSMVVVDEETFVG